MSSARVPESGPRRRLSAGSPTVLLAEDEPSVRELAASLLQHYGYTVLKARHGVEALLFSLEFTGEIHLLLTDICMPPYLNGRRLAEQVRESRPGIAVLYMSGCVDDPGVAQEVESGLATFLPKPFRPETLVQTVRQVLSHHAPAN